jgi:hypothetical protein
VPYLGAAVGERMRIDNPTDQECKTLVAYNWIVHLCSEQRLTHLADYLVFQTAREAIYAHPGCQKCKIYAPQDEQTFKETFL